MSFGCGLRAMPRTSHPDEGANFGTNLGQYRLGDTTLTGGSARAPVEALDLIGENRSRRSFRDDDFKRVALELRGHGATDHHTGLAVIAGGA